MNQYLHKYLVLNKKLSIPDVGNLIIESNGAQLDSVNGILYAPSPIILFKQDAAKADKFFFDFLAQEMGTDEVVAIRSFHDYLYKIKSSLNTSQGSNIPGIGRLKKEENGYILFSPEKNLQELLPQIKIGANYPIAKKLAAIDFDQDHELTAQEEDDIKEIMGQETEEQRADNWWVYALILLLIGVGALLFYYV